MLATYLSFVSSCTVKMLIDTAYLARLLTKPTITIMTKANAVVVTSSHLPAALLGAGDMLCNHLVVLVLNSATAAGTRAVMAAGK